MPRGTWKWRTSAYRRTKVGGFRCKISSKKGGHSVWAPKKRGPFLVLTPKNGGHSVCKNAISSQNLQILCENFRKIVNFLKMRPKRAKFCNLYVKFDWKWIKGGHWVWTEWKKGVIGSRIGLQKRSIDRHLISTDIWECPPPPGPDVTIYFTTEKGVCVVIELTVHAEGNFAQANSRKNASMLISYTSARKQVGKWNTSQLEVRSIGFTNQTLRSCFRYLDPSNIEIRKAIDDISRKALRVTYTIWLARNNKMFGTWALVDRPV